MYHLLKRKVKKPLKLLDLNFPTQGRTHPLQWMRKLGICLFCAVELSFKEFRILFIVRLPKFADVRTCHSAFFLFQRNKKLLVWDGFSRTELLYGFIFSAQLSSSSKGSTLFEYPLQFHTDAH